MSAEANTYNINLANRQIEINEWSYNNKMDTLFVFQILFLAILFMSILIGLQGSGIIGSGFIWYAFSIIVIIVVIIIINRSIYTNQRRDQTFWNKRHFNEDNTKESPLGRGDASYQKYIDSVRSNFGSSSDSCNCS